MAIRPSPTKLGMREYIRKIPVNTSIELDEIYSLLVCNKGGKFHQKWIVLRKDFGLLFVFLHLYYFFSLVGL